MKIRFKTGLNACFPWLKNHKQTTNKIYGHIVIKKENPKCYK